MAHSAGGAFYLRIDDLDQSRSRPAWEELIKTDLHWLCLVWQPDVCPQSGRLPRYIEALQNLWDQGLLYPCTCTRADIRAAASAPQEGAPISGPDGLIYPGTCRPEKPCRGPLPNVPLLLFATLTIGAIYTLVGIVLVVPFEKLTDFLMPMAAVAVVLPPAPPSVRPPADPPPTLTPTPPRPAPPTGP